MGLIYSCSLFSFLCIKLILEKSIGEIWTSGVVDKSVSPCEGSLTINWCQGKNEVISPTWWKEKVAGLEETAISKTVSLKNTNLQVTEEKTELPFFCKVFLTNL